MKKATRAKAKGKKPQFHEKLILKDFTAFREVEINFVPGVNAIIGENGTGKTHLLKAIYAVQSVARKGGVFGAPEKFAGVFQVEDESALVRRIENPNAVARIEGVYGGGRWFRKIHQSVNGRVISDEPGPWVGSRIADTIDFSEPVFMPAIDMMGHTKNYLSTSERYDIDFDETLRDIVVLLLSPTDKKLDESQKKIIIKLEEALRGNIELEGERFYLVNKQGKFSMPTVAEGFRKISTLIRLVQVGVLKSGSTLFWDEPEVNINPILMDEVVGAIFALSRSGVQVFLATHSYVILKELEVQSRKTDSLRFFSLKASESGSEVHQASRYLDLSPNKIEQQYGELYDRGITKLAEASVESRVD
ncbi:MAG: AAA family ATPase [Armatimonadetes bacterium]|nr:AAA family ATPase [Armatimonadota bacterium]